MKTSRRLLAAALALVTTVPVGLSLLPAEAEGLPPLPPVGHVWTVMLENSDFLTTFGGGQVASPYIAQELPKKGVLIPNYYGIGHNSLDNYIAQVSGQAPNLRTKADCEDASVLGGTTGVRFDADGQAIGADGCTYPASVRTLTDQFDEHGVSWKGYMEDVDASPATKRTTCQYAGSTPKTGQDLGTARKFDLYARKHDPFVYFHSVTDRLDYCDAHDGGLGQLEPDLASIATTPQFSYISPNLCDDAHDAVCADGGSGGLQRADEWAKTYIPKILASPAFKKDGLLILTVDEGTVPLACCNEPKGPNLPSTVENGSYTAGSAGQPGPGGGQIGTVMISPFIQPGTTDTDGTYNHYSYLRTMEDLFHLGATPAIPGSDGKGHLGYAGSNAGSAPVTPYGPDVFNAAMAAPGASATPSPSATATAGASSAPSATATAGASSAPSATATATPSPSSTMGASASPSPSASGLVPLRLGLSQPRLVAGSSGAVTVTGSPGTAVELLAYTRPATRYAVIRRAGTGPDGRVSFTLTPPGNTRLYARYAGRPGTDSPSVVEHVAASVSLTVRSAGRRTLSFAGNHLPDRAGQVITVYRLSGGRSVAVSRTRTGRGRTWSATHTFAGPTRATFYAAIGRTDSNDAGRSRTVAATVR